MQSRNPVFRLPETVGTAGRARSRGLAAALGLALSIAAPVAGALPTVRPDGGVGPTGSGSGSTKETPVRPPVQAAPAPLAPPPGTTTLISVATNRGFGNGPSGGPDAGIAAPRGGPSVSANGRWVAFSSSANNLVAGDTNQSPDVFVRDRQTGKTIMLPMPPLPSGVGSTGTFDGTSDGPLAIVLPPPPGVTPGGRFSQPAISADGSAVAFTYESPHSDLSFIGPCNGAPLVVLWRRATNASALISVGVNGGFTCGSDDPSISGDGKYVAYTFTGGGSAGVANRGVVLRDTAAGGGVITASPSINNQTPNGDSFDSAISRDGRLIAYTSDASDLVRGDNNKQRDVFVRDWAADRTELVSIGSGGQGNGPSRAAAISSDAHRIAFESAATNLGDGVTPKGTHVFVRDRASGSTFLASIAPEGGALADNSVQAAISGDGEVVAFSSGTSVLSEGRGGGFEVFARDLIANQTARISDTRDGAAGGDQSLRPAIAGNGRFIAFESTSARIIPGDRNKARDIFLRELPPSPRLSPPVIDFGTRAIGAGGAPLAAILTNDGWGILTPGAVGKVGAAQGDFTIIDGCTGRHLRWTESCTLTVVFDPSKAGDRVATLTVAHDAGPAPVTSRLHGGGSLAELKIEPPIGRPGIVVIATGSGFPKNTEIALHWSRGVSPTMPKIVTDDKGGFRVQVLVFHNDIVGTRDLVVSPVGSLAFPVFSVPFRVVEASSQPPRFIVQAPYDERPPTLVMRR